MRGFFDQYGPEHIEDEERHVLHAHASAHQALGRLETLLPIPERHDLTVEDRSHVRSGEDRDPRTETGEVGVSAADERDAASVREAQGTESVPLRFEGPALAEGGGPRVASIGFLTSFRPTRFLWPKDLLLSPLTILYDSRRRS
jgi:hypothetical protein